jgi:hypothetical protein
MSNDRFDDWVKAVFQLDPATFAPSGQAAQSQAMPESANIFDDIGSGLKKAGEAIIEGAKAVGTIVEQGVKTVAHEVAALGSDDYETAMRRLDAQIQAVKSAGLDATPYEAQAKSIRDDHDAALKLPDQAPRADAIAACGKRADTAADEAEADVKRLKTSAVEGVTGAVKDMRDGAQAQIDKLAKTNDKKPGLEKRLDALNKLIDAIGKMTDRAAAAKTLKEVNTAAQKLLDDAVAATGDTSTIQAIYGKALQDRYGFTISNPANMPNTHLDQVYKMFDKVPEADVVQNKMQTLTYQPLTDKGTKNTGAAYGGATIFMGDYGAETWAYKDPKTGKPAPANGFSISTLHELGHSVDDRFKIMDTNQGKPGGGGWQPESVDSVAKIFVGEFKANAGRACTFDEGKITAAVKAALGSGNVQRPAGITDPDWALLAPLLQTCLSRRNDKWPWGHPVTVGGRNYHEAYANQWWSYDAGIRASAPEVRDYQYRAPGEWFAELYAYSFFNETEFASGVDPAITAYLYGGKSASQPAST